jgi:hypothetical protein
VSNSYLAVMGETPEYWPAQLDEICTKGNGFESMLVSGVLPLTA